MVSRWLIATRSVIFVVTVNSAITGGCSTALHAGWLDILVVLGLAVVLSSRRAT